MRPEGAPFAKVFPGAVKGGAHLCTAWLGAGARGRRWQPGLAKRRPVPSHKARANLWPVARVPDGPALAGLLYRPRGFLPAQSYDSGSGCRVSKLGRPLDDQLAAALVG